MADNAPNEPTYEELDGGIEVAELYRALRILIHAQRRGQLPATVVLSDEAGDTHTNIFMLRDRG